MAPDTQPANGDVRRKRASDRDYADAAQTTNIEGNIGAVRCEILKAELNRLPLWTSPKALAI